MGGSPPDIGSLAGEQAFVTGQPVSGIPPATPPGIGSLAGEQAFVTGQPVSGIPPATVGDYMARKMPQTGGTQNLGKLPSVTPYQGTGNLSGPQPPPPPGIGSLAGEQAYVTGQPVSGIARSSAARPTTQQLPLGFQIQHGWGTTPGPFPPSMQPTGQVTGAPSGPFLPSTTAVPGPSPGYNLEGESLADHLRKLLLQSGGTGTVPSASIRDVIQRFT